MNKVVYNNCYGGFSLSEAAVKWLMENAREEIKQFLAKELKKIKESDKTDSLPQFTSQIERAGNRLMWDFREDGLPRHDKDLVACVEALGYKAASGFCSSLAIKELKGSTYRIDEYDGMETVYEPEDESYIYIKD